MRRYDFKSETPRCRRFLVAAEMFKAGLLARIQVPLVSAKTYVRIRQMSKKNRSFQRCIFDV
jgi:hypothetical protein